MIFRQITHDDLGCASYLIGDEDAGVAALVDPKLDIDEYLRLARYFGVSIEHILETHNHADHVSGHGRLAAATIHIHEQAAAGRDARRRRRHHAGRRLPGRRHDLLARGEAACRARHPADRRRAPRPLESGRATLQVLDMREQAEWEDGHIPGSIHEPYHDINDVPEGIDADQPVAVTAQDTGQRTAVGASLLQRHGARDVIHVVEGGVPLWQRTGWPIDTPGTTET